MPIEEVMMGVHGHHVFIVRDLSKSPCASSRT